TGLPTGLSINPATGLISGTLGGATPGTYTVTVTASDGSNATSQTFTWTVTEIDQAPAVTNPGPVTMAVSEAYAQAVQGDAPTADWRLDEASGNAIDRVGTSTGVVQGGVTRGQAGALANGDPAMQFDGVDGTRVTVANSTALNALNGSGALTLEAWMNPATVT